MKTFGSIFSGFGGADIGAREAGYELVWGIEKAPKIAAVANKNLGGHVRVADVLEANPKDYERVDLLHASPECTRYSKANMNGKEDAIDIGFANKIVEFVEHMMPECVSIENVPEYEDSPACGLLLAGLQRAGYGLTSAVLNSANYGVPQTRKRLIVMGQRDGVKPKMPVPSHAETLTPLFDERKQWVSWYEAIADILPQMEICADLPAWMKRKLIRVYGGSTLVMPGGFDGACVTRGEASPSPTITANHNMSLAKVLVNGNPKAECRDEGRPAFTVRASHSNTMPKVIYMPGGTTFNDTLRDETQPATTVCASPKLVNRVINLADGYGEIRNMSVRGLARIQSFPNWYELPPKNNQLGTKGVGNAVPPKLYEAVARSFYER